MNRWLAHLLQGVMAFSLIAGPGPSLACPGPSPAPQASVCDCCRDQPCSCPKDTACAVTTPAPNDRAVNPAPAKISARLAFVLHEFRRVDRPLSALTANAARRESIPPPLIAGSPPQSKLRVWLI